MLSVLVIDWDSVAREIVSAAAGRRGFYATTCTTAEEAKNLCSHTRFDVIIVDSELYGMPVLDFVTWLQRSPDSLHSSSAAGEESRILVTAGGLGQDQFKRLFAAGVDDFLPKPLQVEAAEWRLAIIEQKIKKARADAAEESRVTKNRLRFENIFLETPDAVLILKNREGKIIGANRAVKDLLGYDGKSVLGKYLSLIFPELFQGEGLNVFGSFLKEACTRHSVPYRTSDGSSREFDITLSAVPWDKGYALMMSFRDVSNRSAIEVVQLADDKESSMRNFAKGAARDFSNIITSVSGNLSLLSNRPFIGPDSLELITRAQSACSNAIQLTGELCAFAGNAGKPACEPVNLRALLEKTVQFVLYGGTSRPVFEIDADSGPIEGDPKRLALAIEKITENAEQAMAGMPGEGVLKVECRNVNIGASSRIPLPEGQYLRIAFTDTGRGIAMETLPRVFDPYFTTKPEGRGLSLARAATIVRSHGGHLRARSGDRGTTFEILLPISGQRTDKNQESQHAPAVGDGRRVLFLDDEADIRTVVRHALESHGFEVYCAQTGEEAIAVYNKADDFGKPFDLVLLDLQIRGGLGGVETLTALRQKHPKIRAVVTSGFVDDAVLSNYLEHGFLGVLAKPFRIEQLVSVVSELATNGKSV
jgi:PAS domain S-box-containing protein